MKLEWAAMSISFLPSSYQSQIKYQIRINAVIDSLYTILKKKIGIVKADKLMSEIKDKAFSQIGITHYYIIRKLNEEIAKI